MTSFVWNESSSLTTIGYYAFANCSLLSNWGSNDIGHMVVPSGVSSIGTHAFENTVLLTDIVISDTVTTIGEGAFAGCSSLVNLTMPKVYGAIDASKDGYSYSGNWTKSGDTFSITTTNRHDGTYNERINISYYGTMDLTFTNSYKTYGSSTYTEIELNGLSKGKTYNSDTIILSVKPGDVIILKFYNYYNFSNTGTVKINSINGTGNLGHIFGTASYTGSYADTSNEYKYYIPSTLKKVSITSQDNIPAYAFNGCSTITTIEMPNTVTSIGDYAFNKCSSLASLNGNGIINIPDTVESIGNYAFADCIMLNKINSNITGEANFPDSLETVGNNAFLNCNLLTNISLGLSISTLSTDAFKGCTNISSLLLSVNGDGWSSSVSLSLVFPDSITNIKEITILDGTKIPNDLFQEMTNVESIIIPNTINQIGSNAFKNCTLLKRVNSDVDGIFNLPNSLKSIGDNAFQGCIGLTTANLGTSLLLIGTSAFEECTNLINVQLGDKVISIGKYAFKNCLNVKRINSDIDGTINVPTNCVTLEQNCFEGLSLITSINIPDSITTIEDGALYGCSNLVNLKLPFIGKSITQSNIDYQNCFGFIFGYTTSSNDDNISGYVYSGNIVSNNYIHYAVPTTLKNVSITIQTVIPSKAFYNCSMLSNIVLPNSVTFEGAMAYYNCQATISKTYVPTKSSPWDGMTIATSFHSGTGTKQDPFVIFDGNELSYLAQNVNNGVTYENTYFILNNNIDLNNKVFTTIGIDAEHPFLGVINGHGYKISNFTISSSTQYVGLFGYFGGTLEHIGFVDGTITSTVIGNNKFYAGLIAYMASTSSVSNIYDSCSISISGAYYIYAGGIAGYLDGGIISNCWSKANVVATDAVLFAYSGGIVGYVNSGTISSCLSSGNITANGSDLSYSKNGQIVGDKANSNVTIENCYKYDNSVLIRFNTENSVYNTDGTCGTISECMDALIVIWDSEKWNMENNWPILKIN